MPTIPLASSFTALGWQFSLQDRTDRVGYYKTLPVGQVDWDDCWYAVVEYHHGAVENDVCTELEIGIDGSHAWMFKELSDELIQYIMAWPVKKSHNE